MSNVAKSLKKNLKKIVTVVAIAAIAYVAWPYIAAAVTSGGAAAGGVANAATTAGATAAEVAAGAGTFGTATATTGATTGSGFLAGVGGALKTAGGYIASASPAVKVAAIQAGAQGLSAGLAEDEPDAADIDAKRLANLHAQPVSSRGFTGNGGQRVGFVRNGNDLDTGAGFRQDVGVQVRDNQTPVQAAPLNNRPQGLIGAFNPDTRRFERA